MKIGVSISIIRNDFPERGLARLAQLKKVLRKCAFDIERRAKGKTPVDTGALRASIYVNVGGVSTYDSALAAAESKGMLGTTRKFRDARKATIKAFKNSDAYKSTQRSNNRARRILKNAGIDWTPDKIALPQIADVAAGKTVDSVNEVQSGEFEAVIGPSVDYGIYVEFGTFKMPARPFLTPAFEEVKPLFIKAAKAVLDGK